MKRYLLASLLLASACGTDDDEIWMPPTSSGKADGTTIIEGSTIPSQYVDASKHYLTGRRIDTLETVGALAGTDDGVAHRADGIIANLPANGRIEAAELARMEKPEIFATLFPDEQMALPKLWSLLEAPFPAVTVNALPLDTTITDARVEPSMLVLPPSLLISSLPADYQMLAKRVQLVFNADGSASTIQIADIDAVLVMPQAFTPAEVEQLKAIRLMFIERATSNCEAKVIVPEPGHKSSTTTLGAMSLDLTTDIAIKERRTAWNGGLDVQMNLETDVAATLTSPMGSKVVGLVLGDGPELIIEDGQIATRAGTANLVERYVNGARQEAYYLALPPIVPGHANYPMPQYVDYKLVTANNTQLVKYPVAHPTPNTTTTIIDFEYGVTAMPNPLVDATLAASVATPATSLPTGRYVLPDNIKMDIYPGSVVFMSGMRANIGSGYTPGVSVRAGDDNWFDEMSLSTHEVYSWRRHGTTTHFTVLASMRTP
jgi:hypothetical protein